MLRQCIEYANWTISSTSFPADLLLPGASARASGLFMFAELLVSCWFVSSSTSQPRQSAVPEKEGRVLCTLCMQISPNDWVGFQNKLLRLHWHFHELFDTVAKLLPSFRFRDTATHQIIAHWHPSFNVNRMHRTYISHFLDFAAVLYIAGTYRYLQYTSE